MNGVLLGLRWLTAGVFLLLAGSKVVFLLDIADRKAFVPPWALWSVAACELGISVALVSRCWRAGAVASFAVGCVFVLALATMLWVGIDPAACGCFGSWKVGAQGHLLVACSICCLAAAIWLEDRERPLRPHGVGGAQRSV